MDGFIGEIRYFPFRFVPNGFIPCDGRLLSIFNATALFSLIGIRYGGDGSRDFRIPDLRGKSPLDETPLTTHYYICVDGIYPPRTF